MGCLQVHVYHEYFWSAHNIYSYGCICACYEVVNLYGGLSNNDLYYGYATAFINFKA